MKTNSPLAEIRTSAGIIRIFGSEEVKHWATPNGSQGTGPTFELAVHEAFSAEGLDASEYGY